MNVGDVVQFNENHEWCGCLGIIEDKKEIHNNMLSGEGKNDIRYRLAVPVPQEGIAYIFVMDSESSIEFIGKAKLMNDE